AASRDLLRAEIGKLATQLREHKKGTNEHRETSRKIGPLVSRLAVIELALAIEDHKKGPVADAAAAINDLKALLLAGQPAARKLGARGSAEAIARVLDVAPEVHA